MSDLPTILRPWQPALAAFDPTVAPGLAAWLRRLDGLIEPAGRPADTLQGEPDGYDGLDRRGTLFRLRGSEWALAQSLPLEFQRRLAMAELLYLRQSLREPQRTARVFLLFDSGPDQLGLPRLVHLALLLLFQHKAQARGAILHWGSLQGGDLSAPERIAEAEVRRLLDSRSLKPPAPDSAADRLAALACDPQRDQIWIAGGAALERLEPTKPLAHLLLIEEWAEDRGQAVRVRLQRAGAALAPLSLPRLEHRVSARCLRNPFPRAAGTETFDQTGGRVQPHPHTEIGLSDEGRHVLLRLVDGGVLALHVPNSIRAPKVEPVVFHPNADERVAAARWRNKRLWVATVTGSGFVRTYAVARRAGRRFFKVYGLEAPHRFVPVPDDALPELVQGLNAKSELDLLLDGEGTLYARQGAETEREKPTLVRLAEGTRAVLGGSALALLGNQADGEQTSLALHNPLDPVRVALNIPLPAGVRVRTLRLGVPDNRPLSPQRIVTGIETEDDELLLFEGAKQVDRLAQPADTRPIGLLQLWDTQGHRSVRGFVLLSPDRKSLVFQASGVSQTLLQTYAPIAAAAATLQSGLVAALTESGGLSVFSIGRKTVVFRHEFSHFRDPEHAPGPA